MISKYIAIVQEMFGALQDEEIPVQLFEVPLLGNISIMLKEVRDENSLSSQCYKTSKAELIT